MQKVAFSCCFVISLLSASITSAQKKVKYKDIFGLLSTKQYEAAEPFLKEYLKENEDPNAYLFMGIVFQEKSGKDDILRQTPLAIAHMDSAISFYQKAYQTITDKEIKRKDEYYQSYNRRDLRTGEFGVKLSDIQFDLEKKMEGLKEKIDRVKMVEYYFSLSDSLYKRSNELYGSIIKEFDAEKDFFLRADQNTIKALASLSSRYDSCLKAFDQFKAGMATVGKTGYAHSVNKVEIKNFKVDGLSTADFYQNDLQLWDYKTWAQNAKQAIEKDIFPIREHLISYDIEINKLREKMNSDSVSVINDLTKLIEKLLGEQLKKYDEHPLPMDVFAMKIKDLEYRSLLLDNRKYQDSADVHLQLAIIKKELAGANELDSIATALLARDIDKEAKNYSHFIANTYSNNTVLKSYIKVMKDFSEREKRIRVSLLSKHEDALRWMVVNATDSIPLFAEPLKYRFKPLTIVNEKYTTGLHYQDSISASGYFYTITPSRIPDVKISFPVAPASFKESQFPTIKSLTYSDAGGQVFYVLFYSEKPSQENKFTATLAKIYRSDGLAWSTNCSLAFVPKELLFRSDTGEFVIRADAQESIVDKNGKVLR